jgi:salicylate hydroxylase
LFNFVAVTERSEWTEESWSLTGDRGQCAADFAGWHEHIQMMIADSSTLNKWALMSREPMQQWSVGRCTLLGDACHPSLPFLAQGANMALEDGAVLARCLAAGDDAKAALLRYEALRVGRTSEIVRRSAENGKRSHSRTLTHKDEAEAYINAEWGKEKVEQRYDWLYGYDALSMQDA